MSGTTFTRIDRVKNRIKDLVNSGLVVEKEDGKYQLTENGIESATKNTELVRRTKELMSPELELISSQNMNVEEIEKEIKKLQRTDAYKKFIN